MQIIAQYMGDEGYNSSRMVFLDEAGVKQSEREEQNNITKRIQRALLGNDGHPRIFTLLHILLLLSGSQMKIYLPFSEGDWPEVDLLCRKNLKNYKSFLYKVYKEQYLEYIENQLYQKVSSFPPICTNASSHKHDSKAYVHLNKRLKPLEHLQSTPDEFKDLCYLLTAKSLHEIPRFKSWQGSLASRLIYIFIL